MAEPLSAALLGLNGLLSGTALPKSILPPGIKQLTNLSYLYWAVRSLLRTQLGGIHLACDGCDLTNRAASSGFAVLAHFGAEDATFVEGILVTLALGVAVRLAGLAKFAADNSTTPLQRTTQRTTDFVVVKTDQRPAAQQAGGVGGVCVGDVGVGVGGGASTSDCASRRSTLPPSPSSSARSSTASHRRSSISAAMAPACVGDLVSEAGASFAEAGGFLLKKSGQVADAVAETRGQVDAFFRDLGDAFGSSQEADELSGALKTMLSPRPLSHYRTPAARYIATARMESRNAHWHRSTFFSPASRFTGTTER